MSSEREGSSRSSMPNSIGVAVLVIGAFVVGLVAVIDLVLMLNGG